MTTPVSEPTPAGQPTSSEELAGATSGPGATSGLGASSGLDGASGGGASSGLRGAAGLAGPSGLDLAGALALVREIPDFPEPGVLFRDLGPVFADPAAFRALIDAMVATLDPAADVLVAIEARGFLLGAAVALAAGLGVVPVRKPGKTPLVAHRVDYALEYGVNSLELPQGLLKPGQRAVIIDDVLATGGTALATADLVRRAGAEVAGVAVLLELSFLNGRAKLGDLPFTSLLTV